VLVKSPQRDNRLHPTSDGEQFAELSTCGSTMMLKKRGVLAGVLMLAVACGGDDGGPPWPATVNGTMTSTIISVSGGFIPFIVDAVTTTGSLEFSGSQSFGGAGSRDLTITLSGASAAGDFVLGGTGNAHAAVYREISANGVARSWITSTDGGTGTVVITSITASRVVGTFVLTLQPVTASGAVGVREITVGQFDLIRR
jgi:hypothetical protein